MYLNSIIIFRIELIVKILLRIIVDFRFGLFSDICSSIVWCGMLDRSRQFSLFTELSGIGSSQARQLMVRL